MTLFDQAGRPRSLLALTSEGATGLTLYMVWPIVEMLKGAHGFRGVAVLPPAPRQRPVELPVVHAQGALVR